MLQRYYLLSTATDFYNRYFAVDYCNICANENCHLSLLYNLCCTLYQQYVVLVAKNMNKVMFVIIPFVVFRFLVFESDVILSVFSRQQIYKSEIPEHTHAYVATSLDFMLDLNTASSNWLWSLQRLFRCLWNMGKVFKEG